MNIASAESIKCDMIGAWVHLFKKLDSSIPQIDSRIEQKLNDHRVKIKMKKEELEYYNSMKKI